MPQNLVQVDIDKVDNEIQQLKDRLDMLYSLKKYLGGLPSTTVLNSKSSPETDNTQQYGGISDFITTFLGKGKADTTSIIEAYAKHTGKMYGDVSNNISNALSRIKTAGRIDNELKIKNNRKAGSVWFLTNK